MQLSVVIPTFNRRSTVVVAVRSVLMQTVGEIETIVVDDGSTDDTDTTLEAEFGSHLRLIRTANRGVSAARNLGVAHARGGLIAFLDSDDLWLPGKLAAQLNCFSRHPELEICQTEEIWIRNGRRVNPRTYHRKPDGDIFTASLRRCLVSPSAVMMRRSLFERVGGFDESLPACEDYDLWLRIACRHPFGLIPEALVIKHGGHADQLSKRFWGMDRFRVAALACLLANQPLSVDQSRAVATVLVEKCGVLANGAGKRGRDEEAGRLQRLAEWATTHQRNRHPGSASVAA